jgi:hypothetical protein
MLLIARVLRVLMHVIPLCFLQSGAAAALEEAPRVIREVEDVIVRLSAEKATVAAKKIELMLLKGRKAGPSSSSSTREEADRTAAGAAAAEGCVDGNSSKGVTKNSGGYAGFASSIGRGLFSSWGQSQGQQNQQGETNNIASTTITTSSSSSSTTEANVTERDLGSDRNSEQQGWPQQQQQQRRQQPWRRWHAGANDEKNELLESLVKTSCVAALEVTEHWQQEVCESRKEVSDVKKQGELAATYAEGNCYFQGQATGDAGERLQRLEDKLRAVATSGKPVSGAAAAAGETSNRAEGLRAAGLVGGGGKADAVSCKDHQKKQEGGVGATKEVLLEVMEAARFHGALIMPAPSTRGTSAAPQDMAAAGVCPAESSGSAVELAGEGAFSSGVGDATSISAAAADVLATGAAGSAGGGEYMHMLVEPYDENVVLRQWVSQAVNPLLVAAIHRRRAAEAAQQQEERQQQQQQSVRALQGTEQAAATESLLQQQRRLLSILLLRRTIESFSDTPFPLTMPGIKACPAADSKGAERAGAGHGDASAALNLNGGSVSGSRGTTMGSGALAMVDGPVTLPTGEVSVPSHGIDADCNGSNSSSSGHVRHSSGTISSSIGACESSQGAGKAGEATASDGSRSNTGTNGSGGSGSTGSGAGRSSSSEKRDDCIKGINVSMYHEAWRYHEVYGKGNAGGSNWQSALGKLLTRFISELRHYEWSSSSSSSTRSSPNGSRFERPRSRSSTTSTIIDGDEQYHHQQQESHRGAGKSASGEHVTNLSYWREAVWGVYGQWRPAGMAWVKQNFYDAHPRNNKYDFWRMVSSGNGEEGIQGEVGVPGEGHSLCFEAVLGCFIIWSV